MKSFASDNYSGVGQAILEAMADANQEHAVAYEDDPLTLQAKQSILASLGRSGQVFYAFTGTAANTLGISLAVRSHHAVFCAEASHTFVNEVGAPLHYTGAKWLPLPHQAGKLQPETLHQAVLAEQARGRHTNKPRLVTISQSTEFGTVYSLQELAALAEVCREHDLLLHIDGCRLFNAAASLDSSLAELVEHCDILSLGGTKNGCMFAEAVVIFDQGLQLEAQYQQKQALQLYSKARFISAQYARLFESDLWRQYAEQANAMSTLLAAEITKLPGVRLCYPVQTNQIFAYLPKAAIAPLQANYPFYVLDESTGLVRLVTSFDTNPHEINNFVNRLGFFCTKQ